MRVEIWTDINGPFCYLGKKHGRSLAQAADGERQLGAAANEASLEYVTSGRDVGNSFDMHRLLHWAAELGRRGLGRSPSGPRDVERRRRRVWPRRMRCAPVTEQSTSYGAVAR